MQLKDLAILHEIHSQDLNERLQRSIDNKDNLIRMHIEYSKSIDTRAANDKEAVAALFDGLIEIEEKAIAQISMEMGRDIPQPPQAMLGEVITQPVTHIPAKRKARHDG